MSTSEEERLLDACEEGELPIIRELVENKAVNPSRVVEKRYYRTHAGWPTVGCTPLHYACM